MSAESGVIRGAGAPQGSPDQVSLNQFVDDLRRITRSIVAVAGIDPLMDALNVIRENPALIQSRLLARILAAWSGRQATFRRADVAAFDARHLALLVSLMDARDHGGLAQTEWLRAADAAADACSGADG